MKKILIANDFLKGGGVENVLENLVQYLLEQNYEITLMIPNCTKQEIHEHLSSRVKVHPAMRALNRPKKRSLYWFFDRFLYSLQKQLFRFRFFLQQYDVLIALKEGSIMRELSGLYAKKKFAWIHTDYNFMHWTKKCFKSNADERNCMKKFDKVVCVSKAVQASVIQTIGDPGNLCVKYNPINYKEIEKKSQASCREQRPVDKPLFVSIGRLAYPKNYSLLIDVCNELVQKYSFEMWIVGDGPDRSALEALIEKYHLDCVKLLGMKNNPFPYLAQADAFISTSLCESYGLAIQEAFILGKPVIALKCPAIEESFGEHFGLLTDANRHSLKSAIESVLSAPETLGGYEASIKRLYKKEHLYDARLFEIEKLWGNHDGKSTNRNTDLPYST